MSDEAINILKIIRKQGNEGQDEYSMIYEQQKFLEQFSNVHKKVLVVSIIGQGRSGKSQIANRLVKSATSPYVGQKVIQEFFEEDDGSKPCTKGVWMKEINKVGNKK